MGSPCLLYRPEQRIGETMSGIVNSTGARSGVIGTTVGTPSSKILQVVNSQYNTYSSVSTTSSTLARPQASSGGTYPFAGTISNVLASSWVEIRMSFLTYMYRNNQIHSSGFGIYRGTSTIIYEGDTNGQYEGDASTGSNNSTDRWHASERLINLFWVDQSANTGTNTYYLGYKSIASSTTTIYAETNREPFTCTLTEIAQ